MKVIWILSLLLLAAQPALCQSKPQVLAHYDAKADSGVDTSNDSVAVRSRVAVVMADAGKARFVERMNDNAVWKPVLTPNPSHVETRDLAKDGDSQPRIGTSSGLADAPSCPILLLESGYVLIGNAEGIGETGDVLRIKRQTAERVVDVGNVRLLAFRETGAIAEILNENEPLSVEEGDFVVREVAERSSSANPGSSGSPNVAEIIRVKAKYVLIDQVDESWKTNQKVQVRRGTAGDEKDVGTVKLVEFKGGRAVGEIIEEARGLRIRTGDFVKRGQSIPTAEPQVDIDYYFIPSSEPE